MKGFQVIDPWGGIWGNAGVVSSLPAHSRSSAEEAIRSYCVQEGVDPTLFKIESLGEVRFVKPEVAGEQTPKSRRL